MIFYKTGVAIERIKVVSLYPFFKMKRRTVITRKTSKVYYIRFGRGEVLIFLSIKQASRSPQA